MITPTTSPFGLLSRPAPLGFERSASQRHRHLFGVDDLGDDELLALTRPCFSPPPATRAPWGTMSLLFDQPSVRTAAGFAASGLRVGLVPMGVNARGHCARADVALEDEVHQLSFISDCVVVRSGEPLDADALRHCDAPVINAGDGGHEHPTQALIDLAALRMLGLEDQRVTLMGNLRDHRTQHSLARVLRRLGVSVVLLSPPGMGMPARFVDGLATVETDDPALADEVLASSDFIYLTPTRWWSTPEHHGGEAFKLDLERARRVLRPQARVLHPFPRTGELDVSVDASPYNGYHRQLALANGVRARLLAHLLGRGP